jgi:hypothetical protein
LAPDTGVLQLSEKMQGRALLEYRAYQRLRRPGRRAEALAALERARAAAPESDVIAVELGRALESSTRVADAREAYAGYLRRHPGDPFVARRIARLEAQLDLQCGFSQVQVNGVTVAYPHELFGDQAAWQLATDVRRALDEAASLTGMVPRDELSVVLYRTSEDRTSFSCNPSWSGAEFDGAIRLSPRDGAVDGSTIRHESLHAQLASGWVRAPRWLDEGLARYLESPDRFTDPGPVDLLVRNETYIPFSSLIDRFQVFAQPSDAALAYAQSEAMVRWLLATRGSRAPMDAIAFLERGGSPARLLDALDPAGGLDEAAFTTWLREQRR